MRRKQITYIIKMTKDKVLEQGFMKEVKEIKEIAYTKFLKVVNETFKDCLYAEGYNQYNRDKAYVNGVFHSISKNSLNYRKLFQVCYDGSTYVEIKNEVVENDIFFKDKITLIKEDIIFCINFNELSISYICNFKYSDYEEILFNEECKKLVEKYARK